MIFPLGFSPSSRVSKTEALYLYRIMCRLMELCECSPKENCRKFVEDENWEEFEIHDVSSEDDPFL